MIFRSCKNNINQVRLRICLAASAGGHISQLLKLSDAWEGYETFCVTTTKVVQDKLSPFGKVYIIGECNHKHPFRVIKVLFKCFNIILRERPNVIISTGAAGGCMLCLIGKLFRAKVIWIDSIANVEKLSLSGRLVRPIADLCLVQWPDLADRYRRVEYVGAVI